jgi:inner membrane protein
MDPLTHTLVGASLAATRLGEKTRLATPALVIGANLPDIDVLSYVAGDDFALGFRRGWTHGVLALVVLPMVLAGLLWLLGRGREGPPEISPRPLSPGWLLGLSYLACLTHPFLDWLNNYGMRWLMPFRDTWFYGDSVFIMDPYLWLILGLGWVIGRRPSTATATIGVVMTGLVIWLVGSRAPDYLPIVGTVFGALLLAYLWKPRHAWLQAHRVALVGLVLSSTYIGGMIAIHSWTVSNAEARLQEQGIRRIEALMAGPTPADPLAWDIVVDTGEAFRWGRFDWRYGSLVMSEAKLPDARSRPLWAAITGSGQSRGFLRWVRFPWLEVESDGQTRRVHLMDARYTRSRTRGFGGTLVELPSD